MLHSNEWKPKNTPTGFLHSFVRTWLPLSSKRLPLRLLWELERALEWSRMGVVVRSTNIFCGLYKGPHSESLLNSIEFQRLSHLPAHDNLRWCLPYFFPLHHRDELDFRIMGKVEECGDRVHLRFWNHVRMSGQDRERRLAYLVKVTLEQREWQ